MQSEIQKFQQDINRSLERLRPLQFDNLLHKLMMLLPALFFEQVQSLVHLHKYLGLQKRYL